MPNDDDLKEYWDDLHHPVPRPPPPPGTHPGDLIIATSKERELVRIHPDGTLTYGPDYTPDEAAVEFWTQMAIRRLESEERIVHLGIMEQILQQVGRADIAYEAATARARSPNATTHDEEVAEMSRRSLEATVHATIEFGRGLLARPEAPIMPIVGWADPLPEALEPEAPVHQICLNCEASPWLHGYDPALHCACGAPWEEGRCSGST